MKSLLSIPVFLLLVLGGCLSNEISPQRDEAIAGGSIKALIDSNSGHRIEIFDTDGNKVDELPKQGRGSVSIYNAEQTGQDNYTFDEAGRITKHLRSYGENYTNMVWKAVN